MNSLHFSSHFSASAPPCSGCKLSSPSSCSCLQQYESHKWAFAYVIVPVAEGRFLIGEAVGQRRLVAFCVQEDLPQTFRELYEADLKRIENRQAAEEARQAAYRLEALPAEAASIGDIGVEL